MTIRRLGALQWVGLLVGAGIWFSQHVAGLYINYARCGPNGVAFGISHTLWQAALMGCAAAFVVIAEAAAVTVLVRTRDTSYQDEPPKSRIRFFAIAAVVSNVLFLMIILLDGFANVFNVVCRQG